MSSKSYAIIQMRRDTNAAFALAGTVLASGEPAFATDTRMLKVGDGVTPWSSLLPVNMSGVISFPTLIGSSNIDVSAVDDTYVIAAVGLAPTSHPHVIADISDFNPSGFAASGHQHVLSDITGFNPSGHQHYITDVVDFNPNDYSPSGHIHGLSEISGVDSLYMTDIYDVGLATYSLNVDWGSGQQIQTLSLDGTYTEIYKGTGWPSSSDKSADVVLRIRADYDTSVIWYVVDNWFNAPPPDPLPTATHIVLLRAIGTTIDGHYLGSGIY
jgi:hypothetical protein